MKNKQRAAIFDMDGLIVDTEIIHSRATEQFFLRRGIQLQYQPNGLTHVVGSVGRDLEKITLKEHGINMPIEDYIQERRGIFVELLQEKLVPMPGFEALLTKLIEQGYKIAVASNRFEKHIHLILENLGVKQRFDVIVGPSKTREPKPSPDIYLHTVKELRVRPEDCVVFEDSEFGILAAKAAGLKTIAVPNQYTKGQDFSKADKLVSSLAEITLRDINEL